MVPKIAASSALVKAMIRLFFSASIRNGLDSAVPYHCVEKPMNSLALRPGIEGEQHDQCDRRVEEQIDGDNEGAHQIRSTWRVPETRQANAHGDEQHDHDDRRPA